MIVQHDMASRQQVDSRKYLICANQTKDKTSATDKKISIAIFDSLDLRKYHVEIDSLRQPTDSLLLNYERNEYIEQYKYKNLFPKEYIGKPIINQLYQIQT